MMPTLPETFPDGLVVAGRDGYWGASETLGRLAGALAEAVEAGADTAEIVAEVGDELYAERGPTPDELDFDEDAYMASQWDAQQARWEAEGDQVGYWEELGASHPAVRDAFWTARDAAGETAAEDLYPRELADAYVAGGEAIMAAAGLEPQGPPSAVQLEEWRAEGDAMRAAAEAGTAELLAELGVDVDAAGAARLSAEETRAAEMLEAAGITHPELWQSMAASTAARQGYYLDADDWQRREDERAFEDQEDAELRKLDLSDDEGQWPPCTVAERDCGKLAEANLLEAQRLGHGLDEYSAEDAFSDAIAEHRAAAYDAAFGAVGDAYAAGDALREAEWRDADEETHDSAVNLERAQDEFAAAVLAAVEPVDDVTGIPDPDDPSTWPFPPASETADHGPHEWSFGDPDETGDVPLEFVTGQETLEERGGEPGEPAEHVPPWDAYRSGPGVEDQMPPLASERAVDEASAAVATVGDEAVSTPAAEPVAATDSGGDGDG